jgi:phosphotransacetylase
LHTPSYGAKLHVVSIINTTTKGATIYIRAVNIERDGEQYGTYYQAVRSYREKGKVKQEVVHLGEHQTIEAALELWPQEIQELERTRPMQAKKLRQKLNRLQELTKGADLTPT